LIRRRILPADRFIEDGVVVAIVDDLVDQVAAAIAGVVAQKIFLAGRAKVPCMLSAPATVANPTTAFMPRSRVEASSMRHKSFTPRELHAYLRRERLTSSWP
jgi:hypothetical protein